MGPLRVSTWEGVDGSERVFSFLFKMLLGRWKIVRGQMLFLLGMKVPKWKYSLPGEQWREFCGQRREFCGQKRVLRTINY